MKKNVLLAIKPSFVNKIFKGEKIFEFRKSIFNPALVDRVYIYSSSPVKAIVGSFKINDVLSGPPSEIWSQCKEGSGISENYYFEYFNGKSIAYALCISNLEILAHPIYPYNYLEDFYPPQSYKYFDSKLTSLLTGDIET